MLSVIIITKNEEHNIRNCLESVKWAHEIIVVDSGSTDKTVNLAQEYTNKVEIADWQGYGIQKQRALSKASGKWVLNLDADEIVSEELRKAIEKVMKDDCVDGCKIPIQMIFYDKLVKYSSSPSRHVRLFKRELARFSDDIVHEKIILPEGSHVKQLSERILHRSFQDVSHALTKINRYSSYTAKTRIEKGKRGSLLKSILGSMWMFFRCYILQKGILDGREGFVLAVFHAHGTFYRGVKQIFPDKELINYKASASDEANACEQ